MGLLDAAIGDLLGAYGDKPKVPAAPVTDFGKVQQDTIAQNMAAVGPLMKLAAASNTASQDEMMRLLGPEWKSQKATIDKYYSGNPFELSEDEQNASFRNSAFLRMKSGNQEGGFGSAGGNTQWRDLNIDSVKKGTAKIASMENWLQESAVLMTPNRFDITKSFFNPAWEYEEKRKQDEFTFQRDWLRSQIKAMPSPTQTAYAGAASQDLGTLSSMAGSAAGASGGGGGGSL